MSPLKKIFYHASSALPISFLQKISPRHTLLPYHHTVSDEHLPHIEHLYSYKNVQHFTQDLDILLKHYHPISADDLHGFISADHRMPEKTFLLSFDDGFREVYDIIAPILEKKGVPAIFFINPAFIDNKELFFRCKTSLLIHELINAKNEQLIKIYQTALNAPGATAVQLISSLKNLKINNALAIDEIAQRSGYSFADFLKDRQPFLSSENLSSLKQRGFAIGAHSMDHPYYDQLTLQGQIDQTVNSCNFIAQHPGMVKKYFSFPYSDKALSQKLFDNLKKTDIDLLFGIQNQKAELENNMLHRFNAERPDIDFNTQLKGFLAMSAIRAWLGRNSVQRRRGEN